MPIKSDLALLIRHVRLKFPVMPSTRKLTVLVSCRGRIILPHRPQVADPIDFNDLRSAMHRSRFQLQVSSTVPFARFVMVAEGAD